MTGDVPGDGSHFSGTYNINPTDNAPPRSGRFFCPSTIACSISVNASGVLRAIQGYTFQPVDPGTIERGDSDYLAWGIWLHVPQRLQEGETDGLSNPATVAAFASGNDPFQVQDDLTGTATYNGVAAGLYSAGGMVEYFDADASLTADFGGRSAMILIPTMIMRMTGSSSEPSPEASPTSRPAAWTSTARFRWGRRRCSVLMVMLRLPGSPATQQAPWEAAPCQAPGPGSSTAPTRLRLASVAVRTEFPTTAAGTFGAATPSGVSAVRILGAFGTWKAE